ALGLVGWAFFNSETADGDIDVVSGQFAETVIPTSAAHLAVVGPLMSSTARPAGRRREPSQLDLLAIGTVSNFTDYDADVRPTWLPGDINTDGRVDGADFLAWQRGESSLPLSSSDLMQWQTSFGRGDPLAMRSVPEPAAGAQLLAGLVIALLTAGARHSRRPAGLSSGGAPRRHGIR
ncbi:MAG: hypothetical protein KDA44_22755, partial [Planctomycetales bacterium]|nr:hypothetical protein [Planctomycetales bacterium]